ncbi:MAG: hypothetical protein AAF660_10870 [Pseudomonadota bacterium]
MEMSNDKEKLKATKQRHVLDQLVKELGRADSRVYYLSTIEVAQLILNHIDGDSSLSEADRALVEGLSLRDIQILLSIHTE